MHLSNIVAQSAGAGSVYGKSPDLAAEAATLYDPAADPARQLDAYQAVASRWRVAPHAERVALAGVLTDSPFGQKVHAVLNAYTRAAWPGGDPAPDAAQDRTLKAFEALSDTDQAIIAGLHTDASTGTPYASPQDYRARLKQDLDAARTPALGARPDTVTLSPEAQSRLAGAAEPSAEAGARPPPPPPAQPPRPEVAAAIAAYARLA